MRWLCVRGTGCIARGLCVDEGVDRRDVADPVAANDVLVIRRLICALSGLRRCGLSLIVGSLLLLFLVQGDVRICKRNRRSDSEVQCLCTAQESLGRHAGVTILECPTLALALDKRGPTHFHDFGFEVGVGRDALTGSQIHLHGGGIYAIQRVGDHRRLRDRLVAAFCAQFRHVQGDAVAGDDLRAHRFEAEDRRRASPDATSDKHEEKGQYERESYAAFVGHHPEKEHGDRDTGGQHHDHVVCDLVGPVDRLEDELRAVDRQVAQHAEVHHAFDHVGEVDPPQRPGSVYEIHKRLGNLAQWALGLLGGFGIRLG